MLYERLLHVPLVVKFPGARPPARARRPLRCSSSTSRRRRSQARAPRRSRACRGTSCQHVTHATASPRSTSTPFLVSSTATSTTAPPRRLRRSLQAHHHVARRARCSSTSRAIPSETDDLARARPARVARLDAPHGSGFRNRGGRQRGPPTGELMRPNGNQANDASAGRQSRVTSMARWLSRRRERRRGTRAEGLGRDAGVQRRATLKECLAALHAVALSRLRDHPGRRRLDRSVARRSRPSSRSASCRAAAGSGPAAARNKGARMATGEVLFFIDSDVMVRPDTLALLAESFERGRRGRAVRRAGARCGTRTSPASTKTSGCAGRTCGRLATCRCSTRPPPASGGRPSSRRRVRPGLRHAERRGHGIRAEARAPGRPRAGASRPRGRAREAVLALEACCETDFMRSVSLTRLKLRQPGDNRTEQHVGAVELHGERAALGRRRPLPPARARLRAAGHDGDRRGGRGGRDGAKLGVSRPPSVASDGSDAHALPRSPSSGSSCSWPATGTAVGLASYPFGRRY